MIEYQDNLDSITPSMLEGFFVGWTNKPSPEKLFRLLKNSQHIIIAVENKRIIGFINAISDQGLCAYIPLLEVLPDYQNQGIGKKLVNRLLKVLNEKYYMIDIVCDDNLTRFYEKFEFTKHTAMIRRNYKNLL